eukprot:CAMPEP_0203744186 /NCGR_PEP_ID=MMETSP0098-20131031/325_1 /ASSEMBLY_ACC=CAM_ASM_000208 /TAXON_ID=96639 /ORGANISM=" , Strain NY0313808BC1" /LENGTH=711 /DNA_ID=CAMNT_0050631641 /DNA_START=1809 /DNA_END=3944 /DNA_ORIENTATION=-
MVSTSASEYVQDSVDKTVMMEERPASPMEVLSPNAGGYSSDSSTEAVDVSKMDPATLKARIKAQVEYYFSQQNLNNDAYMMSQMNTEGYIPVSTIASFKKVRNLTDNLELIAEAVADSTVCELSSDKSMLKTSWKRPARTTIILRDVHEDTTEDDIKLLFEETEFKVVSARSDVGQTWFVTMDSEEGAKNAVLHLLGKTLQGLPVKARLKSEALRPASGSSGPGGAVAFQPNGALGGQVAPGVPPYGYPYGTVPPQAMNYGMNYQMQPGWNPAMGQFQPMDQAQGQQMGRGGKKYAANVGLKKAVPGNAAGGERRGSNSGRGQQVGGYTANVGKGGNRRPGAIGAQGPGQPQQGGNRKKKVQPVPVKKARTPVFKPQDFPSLPMGKLSLDENDTKETVPDVDAEGTTKEVKEVVEESSEINENEQVQTTESPPTVEESKPAVTSTQEQQSAPTSSWIAAVAKAPVVPPPAAAAPPAATKKAAPKASPPATKGRGRAKKGGEQKANAPLGKQNSGQTEQVQQGTSQAKPAAERPKRGWEKPSITASKQVVSDVSDIVDDVVGESVSRSTKGSISKESTRRSNAPSVSSTATGDEGNNAEKDGANSIGDEKAKQADEALLKSAFGAWGEKKSFVDIIKTSATSPGESAPARADSSKDTSSKQSSNSLDKSSQDMPSGLFGPKKDGPSVTSLEGNWRKANRPRRKEMGGGAYSK